MFRVLVLDDNSDILEAISFVLRRKQIDVITIQDASSLDDSLQNFHPDLLLMDIALGNNLDGRNICHRLKQQADIPVVLFSAQHFTFKSIEDCGADAVIEKPFRLQQLYSTIDQFCHQ